MNIRQQFPLVAEGSGQKDPYLQKLLMNPPSNASFMLGSEAQIAEVESSPSHTIGNTNSKPS